MKKLSLQWRITLMTALLIGATCIFMNVLIGYSGSRYMDSIGSYVTGYGDTDKGEPEFFDPEHEKLDRELTIVINGVQESFIATNWYITAVATLLGGVLAYFLRGHALKPLRTFTARVEKVQPNNLTDMKITEEVLPEMRQFVKSFNLMLDRLDEGFTAQRQFTGNAGEWNYIRYYNNSQLNDSSRETRRTSCVRRFRLCRHSLNFFRQSIPRYCRKRLSFSDCYVSRPNE